MGQGRWRAEGRDCRRGKVKKEKSEKKTRQGTHARTDAVIKRQCRKWTAIRLCCVCMVAKKSDKRSAGERCGQYEWGRDFAEYSGKCQPGGAARIKGKRNWKKPLLRCVVDTGAWRHCTRWPQKENRLCGVCSR